jgi:tetratricopeptide (TPR) repeat protein
LRKLIALAALAVAVSIAAGAALPPANLERTLAAQEALIAREPTAERYNDLGNLLQLAGRDDEARVAYEEALTLDEELVSAHYNLGLLLHGQGEKRAAMRQFEHTVELEPDHARAWFQIGFLHETAGAEGSAVRAYGRAYLLDPRLSFSDENPQVLDSKLTTKALLVAQRELSPAGHAPRAYEEPRRIAGLLLPSPPPDQAPGADSAADPEVAATAPPRDPSLGLPIVPIVPYGDDPAAASAAAGRSERVLRAQDLDPNSRVGEVTTAPGVRGDVTHLPTQDEEASYDYGELLRQRLMEQREQGMGEDGQINAPPPYYVPGQPSTGSIDSVLEDRLAFATPPAPPVR